MKIKDIKIEDFFKANGGGKLQLFTDSLWNDKFQNKWWRSFFKADASPTPRQPNGKIIFSQAFDVAEKVPMLSTKTEWSEATQADTGGLEGISGNIYSFGRSKSLTLQQMALIEKLNDPNNKSTNVINDRLIKKYVQSLDSLISGTHSTLNNLCAQIMSKGFYSNKGFDNDGFDIVSKQCLGTEAFKSGGRTVWSDPDSNIYDFMLKAEKAFRLDTSYTGPLTWKMNRDTFKHLLNNKGLKQIIGTFLTFSNVTSNFEVKNMPLSEQAVNSWINSLAGQISPIQIIEEEQSIQKPGQKLTESLSVYRKDVHGWEDGIAVLSPLQYNGIIKYASIEEYEILKKMKKYNSATFEDGLFSVLTYVKEQDRNIEKVTEIAATFAPTLSDFKAHWLFDTNKAGNNGWDLEA